MRADVYLTENGYAQSRQRARMMIEAGNVRIDQLVIKKPSQDVPDGEHEVLVTDAIPYVSRGGLKLEAALDAFGVDPRTAIALDVGASTGGFTDCLLQRGASRVFAIDAGAGQLASSLREDQRVVMREHLNARALSVEHTDGVLVDLIVMDVSFISATYILPRFPLVLKDGGYAICLIKPQFEVGKAMLGKGGVVKDRAAHRYAIERVCDCAKGVDLYPIGLISSPILGGDGNREFLICFHYDKNETRSLTPTDIRRVTDIT